MKYFYLAFLIIFNYSLSNAKADPGGDKIWLKRLDKIMANQEGMVVWWLRPTNPEWSEFRCFDVKIDKITSIIDTRKYSESAGDYYLLEKKFEKEDKNGQGFLIIFDSNFTVIFRFTGQLKNKNALEYCLLEKFDIANQIISYSFETKSSGLILNENIRPLLISSTLGDRAKASQKIFSRRD